MTTFYELCEGKMWKAVEAMIVGLETQSKRLDFRIDMRDFGSRNRNNICFGCAATCTIQQLSGINFTADNIRYRSDRSIVTQTKVCDLFEFEKAINDLRLGLIEPLCVYFKINIDRRIICKMDTFLPLLLTGNWDSRLPKYKVLLRYLKWRNI